MTEDPARIREMFTYGQQVEVRRDGVYQYTGTVMGYTRCESFRIRDPRFGDVCDHHYTELTPVPPGRQRAVPVSRALTPEEIGAALAEAADGDGWVTAKTGLYGIVRDWGPGTFAVLYAADEDSIVTWVPDPDGCELQVTKPGEPVTRFAARSPRAIEPAN